MRICGLQKLSMVDYPGRLAATLFTGGCDLRCPFCHNAPLVTHVERADSYTEEEVLDFLKGRRGLLDGVVLSGGEPLMHKEAEELLAKLRELGFSLKLDTNGCFPDRLESILDRGLVDYVAMDIKGTPAKYGEITGCAGLDLAPIERSIHLIMDKAPDYEFRTTLVKPYHEVEDMEIVGRWLKGAKRYYLQTFVDSGDLVGEGCSRFSPEEMTAFYEAARPWFPQVELRGQE